MSVERRTLLFLANINLSKGDVTFLLYPMSHSFPSKFRNFDEFSHALLPLVTATFAAVILFGVFNVANIKSYVRIRIRKHHFDSRKIRRVRQFDRAFVRLDGSRVRTCGRRFNQTRARAHLLQTFVYKYASTAPIYPGVSDSLDSVTCKIGNPRWRDNGCAIITLQLARSNRE